MLPLDPFVTLIFFFLRAVYTVVSAVWPYCPDEHFVFTINQSINRVILFYFTAYCLCSQINDDDE